MIPVEVAHFDVAARTDAGRKGKNNEDQFSVSAYQMSVSNSTPSIFAIVADGIGGHQAGEVASNIAVEMISQAISKSDGSQPLAIMEAAITTASQTIQAQSKTSQDKEGMGTTCVCAWIIDDLLYVTYVGNSRIYLLRKNNLYPLTNDHTWVQEAVDAGALTPEQARIHPHANVIRRYLGSPEPPVVDARIRTDHSSKYKREHQGLKLLAGDRLLLCTDGLNDMVDDAQILERLQHPDLKNAVDELISAANSNGGKDNITVILLEKPKKKGLAGFFEQLKHIQPQAAIAYAGLLIMGLAVMIALVMFLLEILL